LAKIGKSKRQPGLFIIWLNLLLFGALSVLAFWGWPKLAEKPISVQAKGAHRYDYRHQTHPADSIAFQLKTYSQKLLSDLGALSVSGVTDVDKKVNPWLALHPEVLCVTLWYADQRWPARVLAADFWSTLRGLNLSESDQADLVQTLFENLRPEANSQEGSLTTHTESGMSVLRLTAAPEHGAEVVEIKIRIKPLLNALLEGVPAQHQYLITDDNQNQLVSNTDRAPAFSGAEVEAGGMHWSRLPLGIAGLTLVYGHPLIVDVETTALPWKQFLFILVLLTVALLLARGVAIQINRPLVALTEEAKILAQGRFDVVLPPSSNPHLDELIRIFNYMGEEMDRFQRINVHEIIHDKNKTETMLRNIADGVLVTDAQDRIVIVNKAAVPWFGGDALVLTGASLSQYTPDHALMQLIHRVKTEGEVATGEFTLQQAGHRKPIIFQAHAAPFVVEEGKGLGVVTAIRDITREKEADQIKTELVSMVAHELKSPLTSIYGFSELLLDSEQLDDKGREYAQVILNESNRLSDLINKFLDLARLEAGRTELKTMPFDLGQLIQKVAEVHAGQAGRKKIRVITQVPNKLPLAQGDQDMIEQVLVNLFSNAVKYSPSQSKIGIEVKTERNMLAVSVIDNGYGIPKESLSRIFDKFYRVIESDALEETEGSGLGLTLAREIIDQHGGAIRVNSRLGVGSVFTFIIPQADIDDVDFEELTL